MMTNFPGDPDFVYLDEEERALIELCESESFVPTESAALHKTLQAAARKHLQKDRRINIRLSSSDLQLLQMRAAEEGMPYQTLIASVLHKYVTGRLQG